MVRINGEDKAAAGKSLCDYLQEAGYDSRAIAVEYNEVILPKADCSFSFLLFSNFCGCSFHYLSVSAVSPCFSFIF